MLKIRRKHSAQTFTLVDHLRELRQRLIISLVSLVICVGIGFYFSENILDHLLTLPGDLVYLYPGEAFFTFLKIALLLGFVIASPILLYQVLAFILPGLSRDERRTLLVGLPFALILFAIGVAFSYLVMLPIAYRFFMGFATENLTPLISIGNYISFVLGLILPFGFVFQLPLLVIILTSIGLLTPEFLRKNRKFMILIVFTFSAILTPPDFISQTLMAGPLLLLYEISIIIARMVYWRRQKKLNY